jgi:hypothetical protein
MGGDIRTRRYSLAVFGSLVLVTLGGYSFYTLVQGQFLTTPAHAGLLHDLRTRLLNGDAIGLLAITPLIAGMAAIAGWRPAGAAGARTRVLKGSPAT